MISKEQTRFQDLILEQLRWTKKVLDDEILSAEDKLRLLGMVY